MDSIKAVFGGWLLAACAAMTGPATAAGISIAMAAEVTSIDPHYHVLTPNLNISEHIFDTLIGRDETQRLKPALALSWRPIDDNTWEFRLRPGVKFHDGSDFSAEDVKFSIERPATVKNSPSAFTIYTRPIKSIQIVDPLTIRLRTEGPYPLIPTDLSSLAIVSAKAAANASTDDFNSGKAAVGTGPFKFTRWARGDRIELARNDAYWGPKSPWESATFRLIPNDPARVAALLSGSVQAVENLPTADMARLRANRDFVLHRSISHRLIYLHLDSNRDKAPFIFDNEGKPLERNPLKDVRVRRAISKAVNRDAIRDRVMEGAAQPTGQLMAEGFFGHTPKLRPEPFDPDGAKKLLADAGYPNGFALTLHAPNDRYVNDEQVAQAIAQMLSRAGIRTRVETMPSSVYFSRATKLEFSLMFLGWGADTGEASSPLKALLATFDRERGMGTTNRGRYSNPAMDKLLAEALATVDDGRRARLLQEATEAAIGDLGVIPLYHQINVWAARRGIAYVPRTDERTYAHEFRPQ